MQVGSVSSAIDPTLQSVNAEAGSVQQAVQVSVLKKATDQQSQAALELIASLTGVGQNLDVKG